MKYINFLIITLLIISCKTTDSTKNNDINDLVENKLGGTPTEIQPNSTNDYSIYMIKKSNNTNYYKVKYLILDNRKLEIINSGSLNMGYIKWKSDFVIEILDLPGALPPNKSIEDYKTTINLNL